jgi:hypothetical protein
MAFSNRDFSDIKESGGGKIGVPDKEGTGSKVPNAPRGRTYGLYPKRIEPKPASTGARKRNFPPLESFGGLKNAKRIISVAGIIGILSLGAAAVFLLAEKNHNASSAVKPEQTQWSQGDSVYQRERIRLSAGSAAEKKPDPGNAAVTQEMTSQDKYNGKTETPVSPRKTGSPPAHVKRVRSGIRGIASSAASISVKPVETRNGLLHIHTYPWANIYIDNVFEGTTPTPHPILLAAGEHSLVLKHDGYKPYSGTVHVDERDTTRIKIQLEQ